MWLAWACAPADNNRAPTWTEDVQPLVARSCAECHRAGALASALPLENYASAAPWAEVMANATRERRMPPFLAEETEDCTPTYGWSNDTRLTDAEIAVFAEWAEAGAPEGPPRTPTPFVNGRSLTDPTVTLTPVPYEVPARSTIQDEYVCVVLDPGWTENTWVDGVEVRPDRPEVVHHVLVFSDPSGAAFDLLAPGEQTYPCTGGSGVEGSLIGGWVPGAPPLETPSGSGFLLAAGSAIVMQMHYHLASEAVLDATGLALRVLPAAPGREAYTRLIGNAAAADGDHGLQPGPNDPGTPTFLIPAGATGHTETMRTPILTPGAYQVFAVANHMHFAGTGMRLTFERDGKPECLVETPRWDFEWQQLFTYDADGGQAPTVQEGDVVVDRCTYDNTPDNPALADVLSAQGLDEPVDMGLGEGDLEEMCVGFVAVVPL